ncbi:MAG TPA: DMT family transporter [Candidatus Methylomirabilis sp.]|nr:DMT family transporter [Candidatus Methylomirabilis sp.]
MTLAPDSLVSRQDPATSAARRGTLLVACASVCWSTGGLFVRLVNTSSWTTTFWRSLAATLCLGLVLSLTHRTSIVRLWRDGGRPAATVAVFMALTSTCFILSLAHTSVADTLLLMSTGPFVAGLLGWLLLGERVPHRTWASMCVALAGTAVMVSGSYTRGALTGDLLALVMAMSFAAAIVLIRRHPEIQMGPAAALGTALTALAMLPLADPFATSRRDLVLLTIFGAVQFSGGFLLFMGGARLIPAAETALIEMLETVLGPIWVWLVLSERPPATTLAGGALILAALLANTWLDLVIGSRRR